MSSAAEEKYILEKKVVYRVNAEGKRQKIDDISIMTGAKGAILWFAVDKYINEAMEGSQSGIYFFEDKEKPLFFLPYEGAGTVADILFSPDGKQIVLDDGTWIVRQFILYDFKKTEKKASLRGMSRLMWLDSSRLAFTFDEPDAEQRTSTTDFDAWTSVVVYDTIAEKIIPVIKATETKNYRLDGADLDKGELRLTETSVNNKKDWADPEKHEVKEITVKMP
jgi:hypothetical protein